MNKASPSQHSTRQKLVKIPHVPGLYRHPTSGLYYGFKKLHGKRKERSLQTSDRKIAERRLAEWVKSLSVVEREVEKTTLRELMEKFEKLMLGKSVKTQKTNRSVLTCLRATWSLGIDVEVRHVRPSHIDEWLAMHERRLKNTTYNRYAGVLRAMFDIAVSDRIIAESPFLRVKTQWKRPQKPLRRVPTEDQFQAIVACIRSQPFTDHSDDSADFVEFLGAAGLGQAEASSLTWGDVDWNENRIHVRRHKTDTRFTVPMYPQLKALLDKLHKAAGEPSFSSRVFKIKDAKKALGTACKTLKLPNFTQRNLRQCAIRRLWKAGVDVKLIAKWQGHQDGGQLILDTYTEVFGADDAEYERLQLAKLAPAPNVIAQIGADQAPATKPQDTEPELRSA